MSIVTYSDCVGTNFKLIYLRVLDSLLYGANIKGGSLHAHVRIVRTPRFEKSLDVIVYDVFIAIFSLFFKRSYSADKIK